MVRRSSRVTGGRACEGLHRANLWKNYKVAFRNGITTTSWGAGQLSLGREVDGGVNPYPGVHLGPRGESSGGPT